MVAMGGFHPWLEDNNPLCFDEKSGYGDSNIYNGRSLLERYEPLNVINQGSYGVVHRARDKRTGEIVAMKQEFDGFSRSTMREIDILMSLPRHPSIVEFKRVIQDDEGRVFVVMEYVENDLKRFMDKLRRPLTLSDVKLLMKQILQGVDFLHQNGVMHRDLKPSNILIKNTHGELKICDFGLSRHLGSESGLYTPGLVTLWYRAPELFLGATKYSNAIDIWSVGCIMAEMVLNEVLFLGNSELHQFRCISQILLSPSNMLRQKLAIAASSGAPLLTPSGFDLLQRLLAFDPEKRITARDALSHNWFREFYGLTV